MGLLDYLRAVPKDGLPPPLPAILSFGIDRSNRALDAWVAKNLPAARENFGTWEPVSKHVGYVDLPFRVRKTGAKDDLKPCDLKAVIGKLDKWCIGIVGAAGMGKTAIACEIGRWAMKDGKGGLCDHPMLPVLLDLAEADALKDLSTFVDKVRASLKLLVGERKEIPKERAEALLRRARVLVILDGILKSPSGRDLDAQGRVWPGQVDFPASALVITTRNGQLLNEKDVEITPQGIREDGKLREFVTKYGAGFPADGEKLLLEVAGVDLGRSTCSRLFHHFLPDLSWRNGMPA